MTRRAPNDRSKAAGTNVSCGHAFFASLYEAGADLVFVGHDHDYERFARADPEGRPDESRGTRQAVVGTGATTLRPAVGSDFTTQRSAPVTGSVPQVQEESTGR